MPLPQGRHRHFRNALPKRRSRPGDCRRGLAQFQAARFEAANANGALRLRSRALKVPQISARANDCPFGFSFAVRWLPGGISLPLVRAYRNALIYSAKPRQNLSPQQSQRVARVFRGRLNVLPEGCPRPPKLWIVHYFLGSFGESLSNFVSSSFHNDATVWLPWPRVLLLNWMTIARPYETRLTSRSRIPSSGGLMRSSAELIAR